MKNEVIASLLHGEENSVKTEKKVIQPLPVAEDTTLHYLFSHHLFTVKNASFDAALKYLFINNNVYLKKALNKRFLYEVNGIEAVLTVNVSKWLTWYKCHYVEEKSGEIIEIIKDYKSSSNKDLKRVMDFVKEDFDITKEMIIKLTKHLDKLELTYNTIYKEYETRVNKK